MISFITGILGPKLLSFLPKIKIIGLIVLVISILATTAIFVNKVYKVKEAKLHTIIQKLESDNNDLIIFNNSLKEANRVNKETIARYENGIRKQNDRIIILTNSNAELTKYKDMYNAIFKDHNITDLASKKSGLIEIRINEGTNKIFDDMEKLTNENKKVYKQPVL